MKILLTNDDGIDAPGIRALHKAIVQLGTDAGHVTEVFTVAPMTVQSATSHGITFHEPLRVEDHPINDHPGAAVGGRPADCMKLALSNLWQDRYGVGTKPDLVVSGMNAGANIGINVIYSGTVAAAIEAAFLGVPSIAVSLLLGKGVPDFDRAAGFGWAAIERILNAGILGPHECANINIPLTRKKDATAKRTTDGMSLDAFPGGSAFTEAPADGSVPKMRVCSMNTHGLIDKYERRESPYGEVYYWAAGNGLDFQAADPGTDVAEIKEGHITITPLHYDLSASSSLDSWAAKLAE